MRDLEEFERMKDDYYEYKECEIYDRTDRLRVLGIFKVVEVNKNNIVIDDASKAYRCLVYFVGVSMFMHVVS